MSDGCMGCRVPGYSHAAYCPEGRVEDLRKRLADSERLREDERLTWDAQRKRQASMNAHLAALVTDAQEELRKCRQDAIQLQARLAEVEAEKSEYHGKAAALMVRSDTLAARLAEARANAFQDALDCMRDRQARDHLAACLQDKYGVWWKTDSASACPACQGRGWTGLGNTCKKCQPDQPSAARKTVWKPYDVFGVTGRLVYEDTGEDVPDQPTARDE